MADPGKWDEVMKISSVFSMIADQWSLDTRERNFSHPNSREDFPIFLGSKK